MFTKRIPMAKRLDRYLDKSGECWVFTGGKNKGGYGWIKGEGGRKASPLLAHRAAWIVAYGSIPDGLCVLHSCDNPPCCNPAHLHLGTRADNNREMRNRGRGGPRVRGEAHERCTLTKIKVLELRAKYAAGNITQRKLAETYEVGLGAVKHVLARRTWKHI